MMKSRIILFTVLLLLWIALCSWYYVCKVRSDCSMVEAFSEPAATTGFKASLPETDSVAEIQPPGDYLIYFNSGNSRCNFSEEDNDYVSDVSSFINKNKEYRVYVSGYADNTGPESQNLKISSLRAEFVVRRLEEAGIPSTLISYEGKGEADPVADNNTAEGRTLNRRVVIITHKN